LTLFLQLAAEKKESKNGAARKCFGSSYFDSNLKPVCCKKQQKKVHDQLLVWDIGDL
jgi:hypothetical protein